MPKTKAPKLQFFYIRFEDVKLDCHVFPTD